eukprot:1215082-Amphidinium_carterae.2
MSASAWYELTWSEPNPSPHLPGKARNSTTCLAGVRLEPQSQFEEIFGGLVHGVSSFMTLGFLVVSLEYIPFASMLMERINITCSLATGSLGAEILFDVTTLAVPRHGGSLRWSLQCLYGLLGLTSHSGLASHWAYTGPTGPFPDSIGR